MTPFSIDADHQLVKFQAPVYYDLGEGNLRSADVTLQCAVMIRNANTNQIESFERTATLLGKNGVALDVGTLTKFQHFPDVQLNVTSVYTTNPGGTSHIESVTILEADPLNRSEYYLKSMLKQFDTQAGQVLDYNGIKAIDLDGSIQQVTWNVNGNETNTVASIGTEHSMFVPPYPNRRRIERLPPNDAAADQNNFGRRVDFVGPPAPG
jgi:hypothetical protein